MVFPEIYSATGMMELIQKIGFLPLLYSGIEGFSAEDIVDEDCRYVTFPEGGWDWPLWKWKGEIVTEMPCMYGKFFNKKAGFISQEWWPDFCNYRRSKNPRPFLFCLVINLLSAGLPTWLAARHTIVDSLNDK